MADWERETQLRRAAQLGRADEVRKLVRLGVDVNAAGKDERTSLYLVARWGKHPLPMLDLLLDEYNANVNIADIENWTPLHGSANGGRVEVLNKLLEKKASVNATDDDGQTALHKAALQGKGQAAQLLLRKGAEVKAVDSQGNTALHLAADNGHADVVRVLLTGDNVTAQSLDPNTGPKTSCERACHEFQGDDKQPVYQDVTQITAIANKDSRSALHLASAKGHLKATEVLIHFGANPNAEDNQSMTALHLCSMGKTVEEAHIFEDKHVSKDSKVSPTDLDRNNEHVQVVRELIGHQADKDALDNRQRTPLHIAAERKQVAIVQELLSHEVNLSVSDEIGFTALHVATARDYTDIVKDLLSRKANTAKQDSKGRTALHHAVKRQNLDIVRALISSGASPELQDRHKQTALHLAVKKTQREIVQEFLKEKVNVNVGDINGQCPLHIAVSVMPIEENHSQPEHIVSKEEGATKQKIENETSQRSMEKERSDMIAIINQLIAKNADTQKQDKQGRTALHIAVSKNLPNIVKILLDHEADTSQQDQQGQTPLHLAVARKSTDIIVQLLKKGATTAKQDKLGQTPLHLAVQRNHTDIVCKLLEYDPQTEYKDKQKQTALHIAVASEHGEIVDELLSKEAQLTARDGNDQTPLHLAVTSGNEDTVKKLLVKKAMMGDQDNMGHTPLHLAVIRNYPGILRQLLEHLDDNDSVNKKDESGKTALHFAVNVGNLDMIQNLLHKGAEAKDAPDKTGTSPLELARNGRFTEISNLLEESVVKKTRYDHYGKKTTLALDQNIEEDYFNWHSSNTQNIWPLSDLKQIPGLGLVENKHEAKSISTDVEKLLRQISSSLPGFNVKVGETEYNLEYSDLFLSGSNSEGTKTGSPNEYDYFVAFKFKSSHTFAYDQSGYTSIDWGLLECGNFHEEFWKRVAELLKNPKFVEGRLSVLANVDHGHQEGKAQSTLKLKWSGQQYPDLIISVDLVPVIEISRKCPFLKELDTSQYPTKSRPDFKNRFFLVSKPPHRESPLGSKLDSNQIDKLWRISLADTENTVIRSLPDHVKDVYVICKCVRALVPEVKNPKTGEVLPVHKYVTSYMLKVVFLQELFTKELIPPDKHAEEQMSDEDMETMVLKVYSRLVDHLREEKLPNFWQFSEEFSGNTEGGAYWLLVEGESKESNEKLPSGQHCLLVPKTLATENTEWIYGAKYKVNLCQISDENDSDQGGSHFEVKKCSLEGTEHETARDILERSSWEPRDCILFKDKGGDHKLLIQTELEATRRYEADDILAGSKRKAKECLIVAKLLKAIVEKLVQSKEAINEITQKEGCCTWELLREKQQSEKKDDTSEKAPSRTSQDTNVVSKKTDMSRSDEPSTVTTEPLQQGNAEEMHAADHTVTDQEKQGGHEQ